MQEQNLRRVCCALTSELGIAGWSLNIIGPSLLDLPSATVRNKQLAPDGPAYRLLAFEGDAFTSIRQPMAKLASAKKILEFARGWSPYPHGGRLDYSYRLRSEVFCLERLKRERERHQR